MTPQPGKSPFMTILPFIFILVIIYFFMIRPQSKKAKQQKIFKESLKKGDRIITIGGIHGRITDIKDNTFVIDAGNNVKFTVQKDAISPEATMAIQDKKEE
jgi:preprotein translocase subunit YajC